ncbi:Zinc finger CCCH domain-containing protein 17 [Phytophthora nicotianae]|uniref:Zinc finger CCCH domain-containing protein 17 n=1 Tax=Phytophthora nicotianae TaxID=4792 RepID=A0A0W8DMF9_PHYNI|nr:Zinc finger CCCH domain-containing protein 17 [Phytophthora nicotianae]
MGAQKKKAKFVAKGLLQQKIKQRNAKKKFQAMKDKKRNRFERNSDAPSKKKLRNAAAEGGSAKKDEPDMLDEMDVDDFLNADFLDSDNEEIDDEVVDDASDDGSKAKAKQEKDDDDVDDGSSSEEEDESALDPRYMSGTPIGGDDDDDDDDDDEAEETEDAEQEQEQEEQSVGRTVVTMAILQKAEKECFEAKSVSGLRRLMKIFSDACRSSDAADSSKEGEITFDVQSSAVYNRLMVNVFRKTHETLTALVALESSSEEDSKLKIDDKKWKKHSLVIRRFFSCACYLLEQTTGQDIQTFVLRELAHYIPFVVPCPKTSRRMLKALLKLWAKSLNANVCMLAFVRIRDMALAVPFPFLELCLKGIYVTYMRNTKFTNEVTLPHHILMGNCVVELFGLDLSSSYQHAFVYIRELAIAVRKTITSPGPDSFKAVLNWQFFNQLRVWTAVVCAYPAENQLRALVYPLSQLLLAVVRLSSTLRFAPLRFHCVKLLQQLALATNSFIPTSPALLEVLQLEPFKSSYRSSGAKKAAKGSNPTTEVDLELSVKLAKTALDAKRVHDQIIVRLFELLQRECDVYKFNVAFPEFAVPLQLTLNKFVHACAVPKWKAQARGLSDSIKKRADWIRSKRSGLDLCPKDTAQLDDFLRAEREAAVKKIFEKDASDLQEKLDASAQASKDKEDDSKPAEEGKKKNKKKKQRAKKNGTPVDEETVTKVKKMSLKEFKKSVAAVDAADEVGDFNFSSDEE